MSEQDLLYLVETATCQHFADDKYIEVDSIILILDGSIAILNKFDEVIGTYSDGFLGLDTIFLNVREWCYYKLVCDAKVSILSIDTKSFSKIVSNYSALSEYFHNQANRLNLLLLHFEVTNNSLVSRINLLSYLSSLKQILFNPGIVNGNRFLLNNNFLILYSGNLIHDSGRELFPGQIYDCSTLPIDGEWLSLDRSCLFVYRDEDKYKKDEHIQTSSLAENVTLNTITFDEDSNNNFQKDRVFIPRTSNLVNFTLFRTLKIMWRKIFHSYPFYQQHSNNDSGAACLMMIGRFWGQHFDYTHLLQVTKANRNGLSLSGLVDAGESVGLSIYPGKTDLSGLEQNDFPVIAHWEGNHYIVVYEVSKTHVIISDPNLGSKQLTRTQFCCEWTGYALWISPKREFYQSRDKSILVCLSRLKILL